MGVLDFLNLYKVDLYCPSHRYSYVDKEEKKKEYKPVAPKVEPKKLVRYRDNKIVSLKGERYTEIKRDDQEGDLKKPKQKNITQP